MTTTELDRFPRLRRADLRWLLVDLAAAILPELGPRLGRAAMHVLPAARHGDPARHDRHRHG